MNPYPLAPLNHFTVPFSLVVLTQTPFASNQNLPRWFPRLVLLRLPTKRVEEVSLARAQPKKQKPLSPRTIASAFVPAKPASSFFIDCDSEQEPQPRNLSCKISTRFRRARYATCILHTNEGHDIQRQTIL